MKTHLESFRAQTDPLPPSCHSRKKFFPKSTLNIPSRLRILKLHFEYSKSTSNSKFTWNNIQSPLRLRIFKVHFEYLNRQNMSLCVSDSFTAIKASGRNDLVPLKHSKHERNKEKFSLFFNQKLAVLFGILRFSASIRRRVSKM